MKCFLMHKRMAVADIELDEDTGFIQKINRVYAPEHLPVGVPVRPGNCRSGGAQRMVDGSFDSGKPFRYPGGARNTEYIQYPKSSLFAAGD